ncbi:MAG: threonine-phosphate decarboxylase CobD [Pseudomonadota bacterium]
MTHAPVHGGDLRLAMAEAQALGSDPGTVDDWLDLSTGINPEGYPLDPPDPAGWQHLPDPVAYAELLSAATQYYFSPNEEAIIAAPGTAALIAALPHLFQRRAVSIVSPTYGDHARAWRRAGCTVTPVNTLKDASPALITVLTNPNNPDGVTLNSYTLEKFLTRMGRRDGFLIVDEAFGDVSKMGSAVDFVSEHNVLVLKSFGKFFGLAGVRLGFAIGKPQLVTALSEQLGPWSVSTPAIEAGIKALNDQGWQATTRARLERDSGRLNRILDAAGLLRVGWTHLFTLVDCETAQDLYDILIRNRIYVRRFDYRPTWLRLGLPGTDAGFNRLERALAEWRKL